MRRIIKKKGRPLQGESNKKVRSVRINKEDFEKIKKEFDSLQIFVDECIKYIFKKEK
jgi:predicted P-loop ATPase/GTPase